MRFNDLQHQYLVLSVRASYLEMIQETEDTIRPGMRPRLGCKITLNLDLVVLVRKLSDGELEGYISATSRRCFQYWGRL